MKFDYHLNIDHTSKYPGDETFKCVRTIYQQNIIEIPQRYNRKSADIYI